MCRKARCFAFTHSKPPYSKMKWICTGADTVIVQCEKKESGRILCESRHLFLLFLCVRQAKTFYYYCGGFEYKKAPFTGNRADAHSSCKGSKIPFMRF